jgi:hypothetical protein
VAGGCRTIQTHFARPGRHRDPFTDRVVRWIALLLFTHGGHAPTHSGSRHSRLITCCLGADAGPRVRLSNTIPPAGKLGTYLLLSALVYFVLRILDNRLVSPRAVDVGRVSAPPVRLNGSPVRRLTASSTARAVAASGVAPESEHQEAFPRGHLHVAINVWLAVAWPDFDSRRRPCFFLLLALEVPASPAAQISPPRSWRRTIWVSASAISSCAIRTTHGVPRTAVSATWSSFLVVWPDVRTRRMRKYRREGVASDCAGPQWCGRDCWAQRRPTAWSSPSIWRTNITSGRRWRFHAADRGRPRGCSGIGVEPQPRYRSYPGCGGDHCITASRNAAGPFRLYQFGVEEMLAACSVALLSFSASQFVQGVALLFPGDGARHYSAAPPHRGVVRRRGPAKRSIHRVRRAALAACAAWPRFRSDHDSPAVSRRGRFVGVFAITRVQRLATDEARRRNAAWRFGGVVQCLLRAECPLRLVVGPLPLRDERCGWFYWLTWVLT